MGIFQQVDSPRDRPEVHVWILVSLQFEALDGQEQSPTLALTLISPSSRSLTPGRYALCPQKIDER